MAAGARVLGGRVLSLENDPVKCVAWRSNVSAAGLDEWAELVEGDAFATLRATVDTFDLLSSLTVPLDRGLELSLVLGAST